MGLAVVRPMIINSVLVVVPDALQGILAEERPARLVQRIIGGWSQA
jgi:hypothetical protein